MGKNDQGFQGRVGTLQAGLYSWTSTFGKQTHSGEVQVALGETAQVELPPFTAKNLRAHVLLDATDFPELDLAAFDYFVFNNASMGDQYKAVPTRLESGVPGMWELVVENLPQGDWMIASQIEGEYMAEELLRKVKFGGKSTQVKILAKAVTDVVLTVVDASSGQPVLGATAMHVDGISVNEVPMGRKGSFDALKVSSAHSTSFLVSAPGYQLTEMAFVPGTSVSNLKVALQKGWRSRVYVFDMQAKAPLANIEVTVDGVSVGRTDPRGALWLDGESPPKFIQVAQGDDSLEVIFTPFAEEGDVAPSGLGYSFLVKSQ